MDRQRQPGEQKDAAPARGKGKEPEPSISSRIAASASGLAKDFLGNANADEAKSAFASGSGLSTKLRDGEGTSGPSTWSQALPPRQTASSPRASVGNSETFRFQEGFRESASTSEKGPDFDFNAFLSAKVPAHLRGQDSFQSPTRWSTEFQHGDSYLQNFFTSPTQQPNEFRAHEEQLGSTHKNVNDHNAYDDGAEVRLLLSDPTFSANDPPDFQMTDPTPDGVNELFDQNYTTEEKEIADKIKSSLPPPPQHQGIAPDNPLNLRPEFASFSMSNPQLEQEITELSRSLGSGLESILAFNDAQRHHWLAEWDDVLNSYTDEVWGEMLPAVKEARTQLEEVKTGMGRLDNKAVARLRMILGHVVDTKQVISTAPSATQQQTLQSGMQDLRQLRHPVFQDASIHGNEYAVQQPSHQLPVQVEQHMQEKEEQSSAEIRDWEAPTFHCPYVSCHERFRNEAELLMHGKQHSGFSCPHSDCTARFEDPREWRKHINGRSHHGLVEPRAEDEDLGV